MGDLLQPAYYLAQVVGQFFYSKCMQSRLPNILRKPRHWPIWSSLASPIALGNLRYRSTYQVWRSSSCSPRRFWTVSQPCSCVNLFLTLKLGIGILADQDVAHVFCVSWVPRWALPPSLILPSYIKASREGNHRAWFFMLRHRYVTLAAVQVYLVLIVHRNSGRSGTG